MEDIHLRMMHHIAYITFFGNGLGWSGFFGRVSAVITQLARVLVSKSNVLTDNETDQYRPGEKDISF